MGHHLNRLDEPVFMSGLKPMQTEFGIHHILESCATFLWDWNILRILSVAELPCNVKIKANKSH